MEPKTTSSFIELPARPEPSRAVEDVAVKRASISVVLDAVESALQGLPSDLRYIVKLRYEKQMTYRRIAKTLHTTKSSIHRKVDIIRKSFRSSLSQVDVDIRRLLRDKPF
jgi:RNA polymerase sigma factor (sigma-70 family)